MNPVDVFVIGGGPAGYAAAQAAAARGASVALAEAEHLGGTCVHWSCIPTDSMLASALGAIEARELSFLGIIDGDAAGFRLRRAAARKDAAVRTLTAGVAAALRAADVVVVNGRARLAAPGGVSAQRADGSVDRFSVRSVIVAAGARWELPPIGGLSPSRVLSADAVQALTDAPVSAVVLGGGTAEPSFAVEYAVLLAIAGTAVRLAVPTPAIIPALDPDLDAFVAAGLETLGVTIERSVDPSDAQVGDGVEVGVVVDRRIPLAAGLGLEDAGVDVSHGRIAVDARGRTSAPGILAAGDVTGGAMTTAAALESGRIAGAVAAGDSEPPGVAPAPQVIHALPQVAWIGATEDSARAAGRDVMVGARDFAFEAHAVARGRDDGGLKLVADAATGEVLGVHVVGVGAAEAVAVAGLAMASELTVEDLARMGAWHPSATEALRSAARRLA